MVGAPRDRARSSGLTRGWPAAYPPVSTHQGWPADCRARPGIGLGGRSMPRPLLPSVEVAAVCAAPAARVRRSCRGEAGHAVAPGVRPGSSLGRRCGVWACSHSPGNRDCHVCQLNWVGRLVSASTAGFFVRSKHRFSVPTWVPRGAARSRGQDWPERRAGHRRRRARSGLDGGEHGARLGRVGA
jgi:hypothetical protein